MLEQKEIALRLLDWVYKGYANPFKLDILLTNLCNLKCIFCWQRNPIYKDTKDSHLYELSDATLIRLIEEGIKLGVKKWEFSGGGEPFMRKDLLFKLLTIIKNNGCEVCIITNGTLLSYKDILKLLDLHCDEIIISLDGPNEKVNDLLRPPKGSFKKIINTLNNFKKIKDKKNEKNIKIKINCVISKLNINNITDMVKLAAEYNLNGITFDLLQDLSPTCNGFFIDLIQDQEILTSQIVNAVKIANEYNLQTNLNGFLYQNRKEENNQLICHSDYDNTSKTESILNFYCFEPWYRIFIHVAGNVSPCCIVSSFEDNIKNKTLKEVWMSKNFIDFRNRISSLDLLISCKKCAQSFRIHTETIRDTLRQLSSNIKKLEDYDRFSINTRGDKRLNICLISREYPAETAWGGIGRYTYYLAHGLSKIGCNVHVVAQSLDYDKEYCDNGVFVHRIAHPIIFTYKTRLNEFLLRIEYSYKVYKKVKEIIEKYNIDIVESPNLSAEGFIYSLYKKTPLVTRLHTHFREVIKFSQWKNTYDRYLSCLLEDALILRSDLITCSTYKHKNLIFEEIGFTHKKTEIIPLGVPLPNLNKVNHMKKSDEFVVLYVGRLERRKGIHILFKSIPYVLSDFPNTRFIIIGRDTYLTEDSISFKGDYKYSFKLKLIQSIPEKYLENITFLDYVEDEELNRYYSLCDIFVAPSLYESFGFIYIEAMSYGKPVIGTSVGGIQEIIQDGINGILVPPEDHILLAEVIINLISDKDLRENLGFQARKTVEDKFNLNLMVKRTVEVYRNLLK